VFDQCCGIGRFGLPIAAKGIRVVGVDLSAGYIARAQALANEAGLPCAFYAADAFDFEPPDPCDAAFNWFTSFGYHRDDDVNRRMLDRAFASLKPGGWFALDYYNVPRVLGDFRPCRIDRFHRDGDELWLIQESRFDFPAGMLKYDWTFMRPDRSHEVRPCGNRAYMPHELVRLLERAGFEQVELQGSADGEPFDRLSPRCIAIGQRPAE
jgi:SAM-dependent methyltransferase